jgi:hypothetical protein
MPRDLQRCVTRLRSRRRPKRRSNRHAGARARSRTAGDGKRALESGTDVSTRPWASRSCRSPSEPRNDCTPLVRLSPGARHNPWSSPRLAKHSTFIQSLFIRLNHGRLWTEGGRTNPLEALRAIRRPSCPSGSQFLVVSGVNLFPCHPSSDTLVPEGAVRVSNPAPPDFPGLTGETRREECSHEAGRSGPEAALVEVASFLLAVLIFVAFVALCYFGFRWAVGTREQEIRRYQEDDARKREEGEKPRPFGGIPRFWEDDDDERDRR